jgi:hypothetical protein
MVQLILKYGPLQAHTQNKSTTSTAYNTLHVWYCFADEKHTRKEHRHLHDPASEWSACGQASAASDPASI